MSEGKSEKRTLPSKQEQKAVIEGTKAGDWFIQKQEEELLFF